MSLYVIGIGGTGAKCIEALTHLCAAGLVPEEEVYMLFVDPDRANGSLERARVTLQQYVNCNKLSLGTTPLFNTSVTSAKPDLWSPVGDQTPTLGDIFQYNVLRRSNPAATHLFDVLFSQEERNTNLDRGFRGHPSIGAAVMAQTIQLGTEEPWRTFRDKIAIDTSAGKEVKIFLAGSIFGGTGASGFPTIARLIHNELDAITQNARVGGALLLPYFSFMPAESSGELKASSENFMMSTQAALKSYHRHHGEIYDRVYTLGDSNLSPVEQFSTGAREQRNEPHFVELYAALAAIDFCQREGTPRTFPMIAREKAKILTWNDLPDGGTVRTKLGQFTRFAFAYLCVYFGMLDDIRVKGKGYEAPWYVNFFARQKVALSNETMTHLKEMRDYCRSYLIWLGNIQTSADQTTLELFNWGAFASDHRPQDLHFTPGKFSNLVHPMGPEDPNALHDLWERISNKKIHDPEARDVGRFLRALYDCCAFEEVSTA